MREMGGRVDRDLFRLPGGPARDRHGVPGHTNEIRIDRGRSGRAGGGTGIVKCSRNAVYSCPLVGVVLLVLSMPSPAASPVVLAPKYEVRLDRHLTIPMR